MHEKRNERIGTGTENVTVVVREMSQETEQESKAHRVCAAATWPF